MAGATERRVIELQLKATGDQELKSMAAELTKLRGAAEESQASLQGVQTGLASLMTYAKGFVVGETIKKSLETIVDWSREAIDSMDELTKTIQKVGIGAEDLQKLQYAAKLSGVGTDQLNAAMARLSKNMADLSGKSTSATKLLAQLGVTGKQTTLEAMEKLSDVFAKMPDGVQKTALAVELFGKAGAEMIPLLDSGSTGLEKMADDAAKYGLVLNEQTLVAAAKFNETLDTMKGAVESAGQAMLGGALPALIALADALLGATEQGVNFYNIGLQIGDMLIKVAQQAIVAAGYIAGVFRAFQQVWSAADAASDIGAHLNMRDITKVGDDAKKAWAAAGAVVTVYGDATKAAKKTSDDLGASFQKIKTQIAGAKLSVPQGGGDLTPLSAGGGKKARAGGGGKSDAQRAAEELAKYIDTLNKAADPTIAFNEGMDKLNAAYATGRVTQAAYTDEVARLTTERDKALKPLNDYIAALEHAADPMLAYAEGMAKLTQADVAHSLSTKAYEAELKRLGDTLDKATGGINEYADALKRAANPTIAYREGMDKLNQAWLAGKINANAYRVEAGRLEDQRNQAAKALLENTDAERKHNEALKQAQEQWGAVADAMGRATDDIISGTESVGQAMKRMVATIISELLKLEMQKMASKLLGGLFGGGGGDSSVSDWLTGGGLFSANGNAFGSGGVITGPTVHGISGGGIGIAGENGPEAILPLQRNASGQLGIAGSGGANVTVNNFAGVGVSTKQTDQGLQIDIVRKVLADDVRRGGSTFARAIEQTYGVGRAQSAY